MALAKYTLPTVDNIVLYYSETMMNIINDICQRYYRRLILRYEPYTIVMRYQPIKKKSIYNTDKEIGTCNICTKNKSKDVANDVISNCIKDMIKSNEHSFNLPLYCLFLSYSPAYSIPSYNTNHTFSIGQLENSR